jgi:transposase-like protein
MAAVKVKCPVCEKTEVIEYGKSRSGKQRYCCKNNDCPRKIFQLAYQYNGHKPGIDKQIIDMTANASGIRDISRVLNITTDKVISTLKKQQK